MISILQSGCASGCASEYASQIPREFAGNSQFADSREAKVIDGTFSGLKSVNE